MQRRAGGCGATGQQISPILTSIAIQAYRLSRGAHIWWWWALESLTEGFMLQMSQVLRFARKQTSSPKRVFAETMVY
jgi:hypothetical protein